MAKGWDVITLLLYRLVQYVVPVLQYVLNLAFGPWKKHPDNESFPCYDVLMNFKMHFALVQWNLLVPSQV